MRLTSPPVNNVTAIQKANQCKLKVCNNFGFPITSLWIVELLLRGRGLRRSKSLHWRSLVICCMNRTRAGQGGRQYGWDFLLERLVSLFFVLVAMELEDCVPWNLLLHRAVHFNRQRTRQARKCSKRISSGQETDFSTATIRFAERPLFAKKSELLTYHPAQSLYELFSCASTCASLRASTLSEQRLLSDIRSRGSPGSRLGRRWVVIEEIEGAFFRLRMNLSRPGLAQKGAWNNSPKGLHELVDFSRSRATGRLRVRRSWYLEATCRH